MSTDLDRDERNARSHILECQVEAPLCQRADLPDLGVKPKDAVAEIRLCEALIRRDGVHLQGQRQAPKLATRFGGASRWQQKQLANQPWRSRRVGSGRRRAAPRPAAGRRG